MTHSRSPLFWSFDASKPEEPTAIKKWHNRAVHLAEALFTALELECRRRQIIIGDFRYVKIIMASRPWIAVPDGTTSCVIDGETIPT